MSKKKTRRGRRTGQITLRVSPDRHAQLALISDTLGLDINGLLRLMIARTIDHYRVEAELLMEQAQQNLNLLHRWKEVNPDRPIREFWDEYWTYWGAKKGLETLAAYTGFKFDKAEALAAQEAARNQAQTLNEKKSRE